MTFEKTKTKIIEVGKLELSTRKECKLEIISKQLSILLENDDNYNKIKENLNRQKKYQFI